MSKTLFGTMDEDDAKYYNDQIRLFEQNSEDMKTLLKQQLSVVRSSLGAINNTLTDVENNENLLKERMNKVTEYMNILKSETTEKMNLFNVKIETEGHILRINNELSILQRNSYLLIDSIIHAQKGVLQPQVVSPDALMEALIKCYCPPQGHHSPLPLEQGLSTSVTQSMRFANLHERWYSWLCNITTPCKQEISTYIN
jgi:hypothetical protein